MIRFQAVCKGYPMGDRVFEALKGVSLKVERGEFITIMGPSGSGKSTLMNLIGCLDTPTSGTYRLDGEDVAGLSFDDLSEIRNRKIGFVFQNFNLLPYATAFENVELPMLYNGRTARSRRARVEALLGEVGLWDWRDHRPSEMSGGQQQRVAIARALAMDAPVLLADEPTGNLDSRSGEEIMALFSRLWESGRTLVLVTHDPQVATYSQRTIRLLDGRVVDASAL